MRNKKIEFVCSESLRFEIPSNFFHFQYSYEALFRSEQYALVDNACREYLFGTEFFMVRGTQAQDLFNQIMGKTMTLLIVSRCELVSVPQLIIYNFRKILKLTFRTVTIRLPCSCVFN